MAMKILTAEGLQYTIDKVQSQLDTVYCDIASTNTTLSSAFDELRYRVEALEDRFSDLSATVNMLSDLLRPVPNATTENPNQKSDLEIFSQIEVNPFLPNFIDLDSEEYLNQRPVWNFTVDF